VGDWSDWVVHATSRLRLSRSRTLVTIQCDENTFVFAKQGQQESRQELHCNGDRVDAKVSTRSSGTNAGIGIAFMIIRRRLRGMPNVRQTSVFAISRRSFAHHHPSHQSMKVIHRPALYLRGLRRLERLIPIPGCYWGRHLEPRWSLPPGYVWSFLIGPVYRAPLVGKRRDGKKESGRVTEEVPAPPEERLCGFRFRDTSMR